MSLENAILEHAGAIKELAAAIRDSAEATRQGNDGYRQAVVAYATAAGTASGADTAIEDKAAELAAVTEQRAAAARDAQTKDAGANAAGATKEHATADNIAGEKARDAEVFKAVSDEIEEKGTVAADLDYAKDVRPVLLAAIKKAGKDAVAAMIGKYGVDKADKLTVEQLPAVLAEAQALAA